MADREGMAYSYAPHFRYATVFSYRCPRYGTGRLFGNLLNVSEPCSECELDLSAQDSGDGPAVFVIFIIGPIITALGYWLEMTVALPLLSHLVLWMSSITLGSIALLRSFNAVLVVLEFRHKAGEAGTRTFE